jgi:hypothetical protein
MPREGGASSTPRLIDSIIGVSGILDRPPQCAIAHKADDDSEDGEILHASSTKMSKTTPCTDAKALAGRLFRILQNSLDASGKTVA